MIIKILTNNYLQMQTNNYLQINKPKGTHDMQQPNKTRREEISIVKVILVAQLT